MKARKNSRSAAMLEDSRLSVRRLIISRSDAAKGSGVDKGGRPGLILRSTGDKVSCSLKRVLCSIDAGCSTIVRAGTTAGFAASHSLPFSWCHSNAFCNPRLNSEWAR